MTAAASKYTSTVPSIEVKEAGKMPGATVATTLKIQATPVPIAINVNMLSFIVRTETHPRTKNGQPAHRTTGVASTNWIQIDAFGEITSSIAGNRWPPISSTNTGSANTRPIQKRRVMSASSRLGPLSAVTSTGSNAMPQIGHEPGPD